MKNFKTSNYIGKSIVDETSPLAIVFQIDNIASPRDTTPSPKYDIVFRVI